MTETRPSKPAISGRSRTVHGAYSTTHEIVSVLEPILAPHDLFRRIYPDIPGMGGSPPHKTIQSANYVIDLLENFVDDRIGQSSLLVLGHPYGAHLARGLAARRSDQVRGIALICPLLPGNMSPEPHAVLRSEVDPSDLPDPNLVDECAGHFVDQTEDTVRRFTDAVVPSLLHYDVDAVARIMSEWRLHSDPMRRASTDPP